MNILQYPPQCSSQILELSIRYIEATPGAISGNGGHNLTFALTMALVHGFCLDGATVFSLLKNHYNPKCDPPWSRWALEHKVESAIKTPKNKPRGWLLDEEYRNRISQPLRLPKKQITVSPVDPLANIKSFIDDLRCTEEDIIEASPYNIPPLIRNEHFHRQGAYVIEMLFKKDGLVNIVEDSKQNEKGKWQPVGYGKTLPRNEWTRKLFDPLPNRPGGRWIRLNPMDGNGVSDKNVTAFPFCMVEFDVVSLEFQLAFLARLALPIAAIIFSGERSYHAAIKIEAGSLEEHREMVEAIYNRMNKFGVDPNNKNASRMTRLPGTYRGDQRQRLIYLNPEPSAEAIL